MSIENVFKDFDTVVPGAGSGGGTYLPAGGDFTVEIASVKFVPSKATTKKFYVVEFTVAESSLDTVKANTGKMYTWTHDTTSKFYGAQHVKQFIAAAMGFAEDSAEAMGLGADQAMESFSEEQPLVGMQLRVTTRGKKTKAGTDFTVHNWSPL